MPTKKLAVALLSGLAITGLAHAGPMVSYFPKENIGAFLAEKFDLASIRSSFGPRRTPALRTFVAFGLKPTKASDGLVEFATPDWHYGMQIVRRRDVNGDDIEDLEVCFTDRAMNGGSYDSMQSLLVTRYSTEGYAIALGYSVDACASSN